MKRETVRTIAIVVGVLILLAIVGLGSAVWLFMRSFDLGKADAATASQQFEQIRSRFAGVTPVLDIRDHDPVLARRAPAQGTGTRLSTLRIIAWDPDDDTFSRIDLPFWLLRLKSGPIEIAARHGRISETELGITVEDLERYGPTLILDHQGEDGERVLVWTE
jgi:hypothetical protein